MELLYTVNDEIRTVVFDATISENHATSAVATEHTVEQGVSISDHVRPERDRLSVEVHVTNTPVRSPNVDGASGAVRSLELSQRARPFRRLAKVQSSGEVEPAEVEETSSTVQANILQFDSDFDRVGTVYELLTRLCKEGVEVVVVTSLRQFDSMVIVDIGVPRTAEFRHSIKFTMELVEIRFAETETVATPEPLETRAERRQRRGAQGAGESNSEEERSFAAALLEDYGDVDLIHSNRPNGNSLFR
jgi:hypothetical protein